LCQILSALFAARNCTLVDLGHSPFQSRPGKAQRPQAEYDRLAALEAPSPQIPWADGISHKAFVSSPEWVKEGGGCPDCEHPAFSNKASEQY
jgi:hypothetical protein